MSRAAYNLSAVAMVLRHKTHGNKRKEVTTMKKILSNIYTLAALLMAGAAFTACSSSEDSINEQPAKPTEPQVYTLVIKASKGDNASTRALSLSGSTLNAYWSGTEKIDVLQDGVKIGTATAAASDDNKTTITAILTSAPDSKKDLNFHLGGSTIDFTGQIGLLTGTNSISEKYDYAMDCLGSNSYTVVGGNVTPNNPSFYLEFVATEQAIIKFTLKNSEGSTLPSNPTAFTVTDGTNTVELTSIPTTTYTANGDGVLYVAFQPSGENKTITLTATVGSDTYTYTTPSAKTFVKGKYYEITVKMSKLYTCNSSDWSAKVAAFNAEATANPTLQLTSDININRHSFILTRSNGILDLNGHTLSALDVRNNVEGQSITIKNGTVSGNGDVAIDGHPDWADFYQGTVILEDLTVNKMIFVDGHQYIINSGTYNEKIFNVTTSGYPGKLVINGGKFLLSIHGEYSGVTYGTYELRGGKYAIRPEDSWCATGYSVKANTDDDSATYPWIVSEGIQSVPELGDLYYSDGTYSSTLVSGKTPIGVIAYIDQSGTADDEITEKSNGGGHGLVLCLKNAASNLVWHTTREWVFSESVSVQNTAALKRYSDVSGYSLTSTLSASANASTAFPAAWQAKNYSELTAPSGSTGWFLPSAQQWVRMMTSLGGLSEDAIVYGSVFDNSHSAIDLWDAAFAKAGSGNYDSMSQSSMYWTSSECDQTNAIRVVVDQSNKTGYGPSLYINGFVKDGNGSGYCRVRPVLAF